MANRNYDILHRMKFRKLTVKRIGKLRNLIRSLMCWWAVAASLYSVSLWAKTPSLLPTASIDIISAERVVASRLNDGSSIKKKRSTWLSVAQLPAFSLAPVPSYGSFESTSDSAHCDASTPTSSSPFPAMTQALDSFTNGPQTTIEVRGSLIGTTLQQTMQRDGISPDIFEQLAHLVGTRPDVDIDAQAHPGDKYEVRFERTTDTFGRTVERLLSAVLFLQGREMDAEWFEPAGQPGDFFTFTGHRIMTAPFVNPTFGATVTSPFGLRRHPIKGVETEHTGIDLATSVGSPVRAAADGVVEKVGFDRHGYGHYVVLQHGIRYETWYAHLSKIAMGIREGATVLLGQIVGAVGRSGEATGPHLHFEVREVGRPVDPQPLIENPKSALSMEQLSLFKNQVAEDSKILGAPIHPPVAYAPRQNVGITSNDRC